MNFQRARTVYLKELTDMLRDHRTMAAMVIVPIVLYPLILLGGVQAVSTQVTEAEAEEIVLGFKRESDWEDVIMPLLQQEQMIIDEWRREARADQADETSMALPTPLAEMLAPPKGPYDDLREKVRQHVVHCGVVVEDAGWLGGANEPVALNIYYQPEYMRGEVAARRLKEALQRVARWRVESQLQILNVDPWIVDPIKVGDELLTTSGSVLGLILPLILVLMTITGAIYPAIDLTAGERERGTLESLMVCPVPVIDLIIGKFLVVTTISVAGAALNLASVMATVYFGGIERALDADGSGAGGFPLHAIPIVLVSLVPFAVFMSAIMIAVCSCARTFKEAQNYVTPVIIAVVVLGGIAALPAAKLEGVMQVTPVANMVLLTRELFSGAAIPPAAFAWVLLSTSLYAVAAVGVAAHVFGRESVVFSDTLSVGALLSRRMLKPRSYPSLTTVSLCTALLFPLWFYIQGALQFGDDPTARAVIRGTALLMPLCFVIAPYAILRFRKVFARSTFALATPRARPMLGAILIGCSAWVVVHEIYVLQHMVFGSPPGLVEMNQAMVDALQDVPAVTVFVALAIVPAVCEELFFRGFLLSGLAQSMRPWRAILWSAAAFAAFHFYIFRFAATAGLGVVLGWARWRSGSIWPAITVHALHNGLLLTSFLWPDFLFPASATESEPWGHLPVAMVAGAVVTLLAGALLIRSSQREA
jgi:ABC-2 type transport system permease protein/sodium transport system permease protein